MKLATSSFYHKPIDKAEKARQDADLRDRIEAICLEFPRYGYRRVTAALRQQNLWINHKKVLRIMQRIFQPKVAHFRYDLISIYI